MSRRGWWIETEHKTRHKTHQQTKSEIVTCPTCNGKGTFHSAWKLGITDQCADCHGTGQIDLEKRRRDTEAGQRLGNILAIIFVLLVLLGFLLHTLGIQ